MGDDLLQRVDRLERENRWLKRLGVTVLAGLVGVLVMGQTTAGRSAKTIEAEELHLRDSRGMARATLSVGPDGSPRLGLTDQAGVSRLTLVVNSDGSPRFSLSDKAGLARAVVGLDRDGSPRLGLTDQAGIDRAGLVVMPDGQPMLGFKDKSGRAIWSAP